MRGIYACVQKVLNIMENDMNFDNAGRDNKLHRTSIIYQFRTCLLRDQLEDLFLSLFQVHYIHLRRFEYLLR